MTVVTSSGSHLTVNAWQYSDLFWALRGGGGGTWGVVTSVTYRTRPMVPVIAVFLDVSQNGTQLNGGMSQIFAEFVRITTKLTDATWGGYASVSPTDTSIDFNIAAIVPNVSWEQANATMNPYLDFVKEVVANSTTTGNASDVLTLSTSTTLPFASWYDWYSSIFSDSNATGVGVNIEVGSWLIPRDMLEGDTEHVIDTLTPLAKLPGLGY